MGGDGTEGLRRVKEYNGKAIAQSPETCIVPGMPQKAINAGVIDQIVPLEEISKEIIKLASE
jgi:two-component system chemotaxis response regulator CheB